MTKSIDSQRRGRLLVVGSLALFVCAQIAGLASGQLPDDIQRELNQNLAEQARIQAQRARHQQLIASRAAAADQKQPAAGGPRQPHDPNNYSYQQVSPPIQYSYYQPYGDLAQQPKQGQAAAQQQDTKPIKIDLNNLNLDELTNNLPAPQALSGPSGPTQAGSTYMAGQAQPQQHLTPSFTGAGGLPVLKPVAAANQSPDTFAPAGRPPLPPQAQQGPPLTEADFKDITGGENYGAPGGTDFGMAGANGPTGGAGNEMAAEPRQDHNHDAQLREFGMPDNQANVGGGGGGAAAPANQRSGMDPMQGLALGTDFGNFNPMGSSGRGTRRVGAGAGAAFDPFAGSGPGMPFGAGDFAGMGAGGASTGQRRKQAAGDEFDFASQPSSQSQGGGVDQAQAALNGGAPASLQSLLGNAFPGLGGANGADMGLDGLARGSAGQTVDSQLDSPQRQQRPDDGSLDIADLGDRADGFSGADLGGFEQPAPQNDQDFNYAAAAEQQPRTVPYPDGSPQFVGTLWALSQPQSLTQQRYNPLPDKGTYQDYPAYQAGGNDFTAVRAVVEATPRARPPGPDRYARPAPSQLAPEYREAFANMDYSQPPKASLAAGGLSNIIDHTNHNQAASPRLGGNTDDEDFF